MNKTTAPTDLVRYSFPVTGTEIRTVVRNGTPWFVASDVTDVLEISRTHDAVRGLDDDEKGTEIIRTPGGDQWVTVINESGLYSLVLRSRKPQAKTFKKWVTSEVIPSIRMTGSYNISGAVDLNDPLVALERLATSFSEAIEVAKTERARADVAEKRVLELEPAAAQAELYAEADSLKELRSFARDIQQLGLGRGIKVSQQEVYDYLGKIGVVIRGSVSERNQATAKALVNGWAKNSTHLFERSDKTTEKVSYAKLTAKGEQYAMGRAVKSMDKFGTLNVVEIAKMLVPA